MRVCCCGVDEGVLNYTILIVIRGKKKTLASKGDLICGKSKVEVVKDKRERDIGRY